MFSLRHVEEDRWTVISEDDETVFTGTLRECEDWLDAIENQQLPRGGFFKWLGRLFGKKKTVASRKSEATDSSPPQPMEPIRGNRES